MRAASSRFDPPDRVFCKRLRSLFQKLSRPNAAVNSQMENPGLKNFAVGRKNAGWRMAARG
jgi:hypothetical protein